MNVEFYRHSIDQTDIANVAEAMRGRFLTTGEWTERFEKELAAFAGRKRAVGVTSGTAGLHLALAAVGVGPGDEVLTSPLSFVATSNAIHMCGGVPSFADVDPCTGNVDVRALNAAVTSRAMCVLPIHLYGVMCDMAGVRAFADAHGLKVVEDAAHALEARIFTPDGRTIAPGDLADAAVFSFYATKSITSGEGGAVVTDDDLLADRVRVMRLHGISKGAAERYGTDYRHYDMVDFGWKYNMSNIQAAMLIGQLPRADALRARREKLDSLYRQALADIEGVAMPSIPPGARSGHHLFTIWVEPRIRDAVLAGLGKRGVGVAVNYRPIHLMSWYREKFGFRPGMFPDAERIGASTISLPFYPKLSESEVEYVAASVRDAVREASRR